jgi:hypothetical protein
MLATTWVHVAQLLRMPLYISSKSLPPQTVHAELLTLAYLTPMVGAKEAGQCRRNIMTKPQPRAHFYIIVIHHSIYYHVVWDSSKRRKTRTDNELRSNRNQNLTTVAGVATAHSKVRCQFRFYLWQPHHLTRDMRLLLQSPWNAKTLQFAIEHSLLL